MIEPPIGRVLAKTNSRFGLVVLAARRARQINAYFNELGEGYGGTYVPPQVHSLSRQPLSIALEEIDEDKVIIDREIEEAEEL
ncbi:MAG: DNA-directed RNA polymerase subunit omega [Acidimicrobiia bacterium]